MKIFGFAGFSGSGKTTLIEQLIPLFIARGLKVALIKHAHHAFDVDQPGKDSYRHRQAGAGEVLVSSSRRWALMHELRGAVGEALLHPHDANIVAVATDAPLATRLPVFDLNQPDKIAEFIMQHLSLHIHSVELPSGTRAS